MLSILEFIDDEGRIFRGIIFLVFVYYLTKYRKLKNIGSVLIGTLMIIDSSSPYKKVK